MVNKEDLTFVDPAIFLYNNIYLRSTTYTVDDGFLLANEVSKQVVGDYVKYVNVISNSFFATKFSQIPSISQGLLAYEINLELVKTDISI